MFVSVGELGVFDFVVCIGLVLSMVYWLFVMLVECGYVV